MPVAKHDQNARPTIICASYADGFTIVPIQANPVNHALEVSDVINLDNGDFSDQPPFNAPTSTFSRWINGTAIGSLTDYAYGWGVAQITSGTGSARFDNVGGINCITIVATGLTKAGSTIGQISFTNIRDYTASTINAYNSPFLIPVIAGVHYTITGDYYIQSCSDTINVATNIKMIWYQSDGITRISTTSTTNKFGTVLNTWLPATGTTFTAPAGACYLAMGGVVQATNADGSGRAMTVSWGNLSITDNIGNYNNSGNAMLDANSVPVWLAESSDGSGNLVEVYGDPATGKVLIDNF